VSYGPVGERAVLPQADEICAPRANLVKSAANSYVQIFSAGSGLPVRAHDPQHEIELAPVVLHL